MGRLIQAFKEAGQPTDDIKVMLTTALLERNRLAHHYFAEKSVAFTTAPGRQDMIAELKSVQKIFKTTAAMIDDITMPMARRYGFTEEMEKHAMQEMMASFLKSPSADTD